ncbi:hypothetical protein C9J41_19145 [Photobacterium sp. GB-50]|uniref:hypothetical protein n=1 Tax=Photobacterium sp. GB-50 TaxID=2022107 RepID=UPI000D1777ED|nr:hypothetical protein [Photobacterium sp. GB-50]PSW71889.1 hypothetical protein C9J41_19145 [Photobacterium sp. GB-50]
MASAQVSFDDIITNLSNNTERFIYQFNFSACELWLCNEICRILNFEEGDGTSAGKNEFAYNEDNKRDISIYKSLSSSESSLLEHIEVKVVYPSQNLTRDENWLDSLVCKLDSASGNNDSSIGYHGWVFFVWTSDLKYSKKYPEPEMFFDKDVEFIQNKIGNCYESPSRFKSIDVIDGNFEWRGEDKFIVVKGMQFTKIV